MIKSELRHVSKDYIITRFRVFYEKIIHKILYCLIIRVRDLKNYDIDVSLSNDRVVFTLQYR